jgi:hypothetical protein
VTLGAPGSASMAGTKATPAGAANTDRDLETAYRGGDPMGSIQPASEPSGHNVDDLLALLQTSVGMRST